MVDDNLSIDEVDDPSEELGYSEFDWAKLPPEEVSSHDTIIGMRESQALALDLDTLGDLERWAVAQVLLDANNADGDTLTDALIYGKREHPAIDYLGLAVERCYDYVIEDNPAEGRRLLSLISTISDDDDDVPLALEAMILFAEGDESRSMAKYQDILDEYGESAETLLNIAGHFSMLGLPDRATELLDQAEILARTDNDQALIQLALEFRRHLQLPATGDETDV